MMNILRVIFVLILSVLRLHTRLFVRLFVSPIVLQVLHIFTCSLFAQDAANGASNLVPPKREFRAVWIPTVFNITWPQHSGDAPSKQRHDFIRLLDEHKTNGINAVIVQVRPSADAFYAKSREPWSQWLTGVQGKPPEPYWDPLAFMIREAHKRGMEFHAWFNPYRSVSSSLSKVSPDHISQKHPEWHLTYTNPHKLLNPGLPQVREHVTNVVMDVVRGYDIDGVHFDDYFYPYDGTGNQDAETFARYSRGITKIDDWRRDNINLLIKMVYDSIRAVKPYVKFGISPFGVWKTGVPAGVVAADTVPLDLYGAYSVIYCDALAWLQAGTVDYIMPQLYWMFGSKKDYAKLMPWWLSQVTAATNGSTGGRHLYTGNAAYRLADKSNWSASEIMGQIRLNRARGAHGCSFFSSATILKNAKGIQDSLRMSLFRYPALPPTMPWKDAIPPLAPINLTYAEHERGVLLTWQAPAPARDGDTARYFIVYRFGINDRINTDDPRFIRAITAATQYVDTNAKDGERYTYIVTAVDKLHNESEFTTRVNRQH